MSAICQDHGQHEISEPHGPWWLTARLPLPGTRRHLYVGTGTARRWIRWELRRWAVQTPWLTVGVVGRRRLPELSTQRWCAHIDVRYTGEDAR